MAVAAAAKIDAAIAELDREATRRADWERWIENRLFEIGQHEALSIPALSLRQYRASGPDDTEDPEESEGR